MGVVFVAGFVVATLIFLSGGRLKEFKIGPAVVELPGNTPSAGDSHPQVGATQTGVAESPSVTAPAQLTPTSASSSVGPTVVAYPTPRPANSISREEVRQLHLGHVSVEEVSACLAEAHTGPRPFVSFRKGDTLPATALIATDFKGGGMTYDQLPVIPICQSNSWGLFESHESFTAPYEGAYWFIVP